MNIASDSLKTGGSYIYMFYQGVFALIIVLLLIALVYWLFRKSGIGKRYIPQLNCNMIEIVSRFYLSPKTFLLVLRIVSDIYVVSVSDQSVQKIAGPLDKESWEQELNTNMLKNQSRGFSSFLKNLSSLKGKN
jgi:flagellar biogenesis protein FliO